MILLNKPYVSGVLSRTLADLKIPVLKVDKLELPFENELALYDANPFFDQFVTSGSLLLCNSENAYPLIAQYLPNHPINHTISMFKDKGRFRKLLQAIYPDFFFKTLEYEHLDSLLLEDIPYPVIIKPSVGYSSIGVYRVNNLAELESVLAKVKGDMDRAKQLYPNGVLSENSFIVEEWIDGIEYAVDAYYDSEGEPVVLNLFKRMFAHERDMSDRIYYTCKQVISETMQEIVRFMRLLNSHLNLKDFPLHFEVRITEAGRLVPIEVNPLRFAGVGTTELGRHAYGINVYDCFFNRKKPDWEAILDEMDDDIYSFMCAEFSLGYGKNVRGVDCESFKDNFGSILEYRCMPYKDYPIFAVVFYQSADLEENKRLLSLDLDQYLFVRDTAAVL